MGGNRRASAAARSCLDDYRIARSGRNLLGFRQIADRAIRAGDEREVDELIGPDVKREWITNLPSYETPFDGELLDAICDANDVPTELVMKLLDIERASHGLKRRHAVHTRIEDAFRLDWRDMDVIVEQRRRELGIVCSAGVTTPEQAERVIALCDTVRAVRKKSTR